MDEKRYFIQLAYKGTDFFGWQIQPNAITVQQVLGEALQKINRGKPVKLTGCGRTDTGVHASCFFAHVNLAIDLPLDKLTFKLNCMLPESIAVQEIKAVAADLHARFSATARTYHYFIHSVKNPFLAETSWHLKKKLDLDLMNTACQQLFNRKNFKCFSKTISGDSSFECDVMQAEWTATANGYQFTIKANRFLRNMVRAIVGTMVDVGTGKITLDEFNAILNSEDRNKAGTSAPAQGLFLVQIDY